MDSSHPSSDWHWLHERVRRDGEASHPVVYSGFAPSTEGGDPWTSNSGLAELDQVREHLESLEDAPRVLVITDVEDDPSARVFAAIVLARSLAEAGQSCVLVDGDLRHVGLARHLPVEESEVEGLVDVVQYGASVPASLRPTPVEGVKVLGAGSWRPDGSEVFADEDLRRLVSQLRSTGHTVILLTPAFLPDDRFHPMLVHGDLVLVALHLDRSLAPALEEMLDYLRGLGVPIGGVVAFAGRASIDLAVDDALHEARSRAVEPIRAPEPSPQDDVESDREPEPAPDPLPVREDEPVKEVPPVTETQTWKVTEPSDRSSPIFRWGLVGLVVACIAFAGWFYSTQRNNPEEHSPLARAAGEARPTPGRSDASAEPEGSSDSEMLALDDSLANAAVAGGLGAGEPPVEDEPDPATNPTVDPATPDPEVAADTRSEPEAPTPAPVERASTEDVLDSALELALRREVGGGYALYPWSFPDSMEAVTAAQKLVRQGMSPSVRGAEIEGRGRWFRVLVGRYDTRAQAMQARELLSSRRDVDWVGVMRVN